MICKNCGELKIDHSFGTELPYSNIKTGCTSFTQEAVSGEALGQCDLCEAVIDRERSIMRESLAGGLEFICKDCHDPEPINEQLIYQTVTDYKERLAEIESLQSRISEAEAVIDGVQRWHPTAAAQEYRHKYPKESTTSAEGESQDSN